MVLGISFDDDEDHAFVLLEANIKAKGEKRSSKQRKKKNDILKTNRRG